MGEFFQPMQNIRTHVHCIPSEIIREILENRAKTYQELENYPAPRRLESSIRSETDDDEEEDYKVNWNRFNNWNSLNRT